MCNNSDKSSGCRCCRNELNLEKLCVDCIKACGAKIHKIESDNLCVQSIEVKNLAVENEVANNVCVSGMLQVSKLQVDQAGANNICIGSANINNACISNLKVENFDPCVKYRAAVTIASDTVYSLGGNIEWNVVLDDPNSNVSLSPFSYTVPVTGYYIISYFVRSDLLAGASVIAGVPIGLLTTSVNGLELRQFQSSYLSFAGIQNANLASLVLLNAGDVVRMKYDVLILDPSAGLVPYTGSILLKGNGLFPGQSGFEIHYLSSLNCTPGMCIQCPPVVIPCNGVLTPCLPLDMCDNQGSMPEPCDSCQ